MCKDGGGDHTNNSNYEKRTSSLQHTIICKYKISQIRDQNGAIL